MFVCFFNISVLNYLYFSNYPICWRTYTVLRMSSESRESFPGEHLTSTVPLGSRKQSCDLARWRTTSHVGSCQFESPTVPCAASLGDYLGFSGHVNASWEQPLHRNAQFFFLVCLFASHTVLQFNMLNQLWSRWLQLNCLHKSRWKYLEESHLGLFWAKWREFRIGCSCISFCQALDDNVLGKTSK